MRYAVGIDLGGTHLRVALIDESGKIIAKVKEEVIQREVSYFQKRLISLIREVVQSSPSQLVGIGVGLPGICDSEAGIAHQLPHYPDWRDLPVKDWLIKEFSLPVFVDNDANMACLGEHWLGVAKNLSSFILLTLGTGIGGGFFFNGKLWRGESGFAGEVGHMTIQVDGPLCTCGKRGCFEVYAASQAVPKGETLERLALSVTKGDTKAKDFWQKYGFYLGVGIANLAHILDVEHFILSGGIVAASPYFLDPCFQTLKERVYPKLMSKISVMSSALGGDANLFGAASSLFFPGKFS